MGVVYRAWDSRLERPVAIKVLKERSDADVRERMLREARHVSALSHPNVCAVYDVGEADGAVFIVMEYAEGRSLATLVSSGPLPVASVLAYGRQVADALAHAHDRGIIHRDLKCTNVVVSLEGYVKVLDFGLARRIAVIAGDDMTRSTDVHQVAGTFAYMAPEILRGEPPDPAADLWALGVMLYEMASGHLPFQGQSGFDLTAAILLEPLPPLPRTVPPALAAIIERSLGKERSWRYRHAMEVRAALEATAAGLTRPAGVGRSSRSSKAKPRRQPRIVKSIAVLPMANLSADPAQEFFADGMTEALITSLARIGALRVVSRTSVMRLKGTRQSLGEIATDLHVDAVVEGSVLRSGDRVRVSAQLIHAASDTLLWAETYDRALRDVLQLQDDVAKAIAGQIEVTLTPQEQKRLERAGRVLPQAYEAWLKGRHHWNRRTVEHLHIAVDCFQHAIELDPQWAGGYAGLADAWNVLGFWGALPSGQAFPAAKAAAERALGLDPDLAEAHASLAYALYYYDRDWVASERAFRAAIERNQAYATAHHWYAFLLITLGRREEAFAEIARAQELDPLALIIQVAYGLIAYFANDDDLAARKCRGAVGLDASFVMGHVWLGWAELQRGRVDEAVRELEHGVRLSNQAPDALVALAYGLAGAGRAAEAHTILRDLTSSAEEAPVSPYAIAAVHTALGEVDAAFAWLDRGVDERAAWAVFLNVDPRFAPLRQDARFSRLLARLGL
jgi:TolB-like protein/Tfp pilus assembly protein PilF